MTRWIPGTCRCCNGWTGWRTATATIPRAGRTTPAPPTTKATSTIMSRSPEGLGSAGMPEALTKESEENGIHGTQSASLRRVSGGKGNAAGCQNPDDGQNAYGTEHFPDVTYAVRDGAVLHLQIFVPVLFGPEPRCALPAGGVRAGLGLEKAGDQALYGPRRRRVLPSAAMPWRWWNTVPRMYALPRAD